MYILLTRKSETGDFNAQKGEKCLDKFLYRHELKSLNMEATCYKNAYKPRCIDLILTNSPRSLFNIETYFTGLSDSRKLVLSIFKSAFSKTGPKEMMYTSFKENFLGVLNKHDPLIKKVLRSNYVPYVTK